MWRPVRVLGLLLCATLAGAGALADEHEREHEHGDSHERAEAKEREARADRALLEEARSVDERVLVERARTTRLQAYARTEEYLARLEASPERPGASAAKERLVAAWTASAESVAAWWPISQVRVCGNETLHFESAMLDDNQGRREATLGEARARLRRCVDNARLVTGAMERASAELEGAMRAAEAVVGPVQSTAKAPAPAAAR